MEGTSSMSNSWYNIVLWLGEGGGGKTTGMMRNLKYEMTEGGRYKNAYTNLQKERGIQGVEHIKFEELKDLRGELKGGQPTTLLCLDQLHKYMDSRQSMSPRNKYMTDITIEMRQHGFDLRGTTWAQSSIDLRIRKFKALMVLSEHKQKGFLYTYADAETARITHKRVSYDECQREYWPHFDMDELVEDIDPRWDPRMSPTAPGEGKRRRSS